MSHVIRETLLAARGLTWQAGGRTILGPLDLDVRGGECLAVVGPNGAGKTTLLRLLTGLAHPAAGTLSFGGRPFARLSRRELARRIAYVPQIRPAHVPLAVEEVVLL
ncbi:MAG TPA: ABC transporter ATP-binding protein, partial [Thermoanaerobaculia bacterium]